MPLSVAHPTLFSALLAPLVALALLLFFRPPAQIVVSAIVFLPSKPYSIWHWSQWAKFLVIGAMICLALAASGLTLRNSTMATSGSSIIICLDASPSMEACDWTPEQLQQLISPALPPTRLQIARQMIEAFLAQHRGVAIGLVAFARVPYLVCPLMTNHTILEQRLQELTTADFEDGTAIGDAILCAWHAIPEKQRQNAAIVLLSDGADHGNSLATPEQTAQQAQKSGVRIFTVGIGSALGRHPIRGNDGELQWQQVAEELDEQQLQQIAQISGGNYIAAQNIKTPNEINDFLKQNLNVTKPTKKQTVELTAYLLLATLALLGASVLVETNSKPKFN